jgi:phosphate transport system permease protein
MAALADAASTTEVVRRNLRGPRVDVRGMAFEILLLLALLISLSVLIALIGQMLATGWSVIADRGGDFLQGNLSTFSAETAGLKQALIGSFMTILFVLVVSFPVGVGAAVYLEEYAPDNRITRFINVNIRNLAGVPSIVYGLLGLAIFVELFEWITGGRTAVSGGLTLALLVLPIIIITSAEALRAVPQSIREAGYGVGATKWEVIRSHVLPSAAPGILTGTVLSISRALGESAPVLLVGAVTGTMITGAQSFWEQLTEGRFTTLPTVVYAWARQANPDFQALTAAAIIVLLTVILLANTAAIILRNRFERKW